VKFADRVGKAARTPARDALISTSVDSSIKGKAFGFHRAMDRVGATGGPLLAMLVLALFDNNIRLVFLYSVIPGLLALFFIQFARETGVDKRRETPDEKRRGLRNTSFIVFLISIIMVLSIRILAFCTRISNTNDYIILHCRNITYFR